MRRVAILITASRDASFYSQIAALSAALRELPWRRWQPAVHAYFGGTGGPNEAVDWRRFAPYLQEVHVHDVPEEMVQREGNWAQADAAMKSAPDDADVLVSMDADTFPVAGFEDVLDRVADEDLVAGVMAHYPPPTATAPRADWARAAEGVVNRPLSFSHTYSLAEPGASDEHRVAPFYVNGGVVLYARECFDVLTPLYLEIRAKLSTRVTHEAFTGQVALTLAATEAGLNTWALPMRYNFPNDPIAARLHPVEAENVVIYHYLRTDQFDRHRIFASSDAFDQFLAMELDGPGLGFQNAVKRIFSARYPFV